MHPYATDSNERARITFGLAVISVCLAWLLSRCVVASHLLMPWWLDAPSAMGIFGGAYSIFDRSLWRARWVHRIGLVRVPVLEGKWRGHVRSSFDEHAEKHDVSAVIRQSWTKLSLSLESQGSVSQTLAASLLVDAPEGATLSYQYRNEPIQAAIKTMQIHYGTARLFLREMNVLDGEYYSGRGRQTFGSIHLKRDRSDAIETS